jgi:phage terminase large subunit
MSETVDIEVNRRLQWLCTKPKRVKIAVGGRGSGKSIGVGDIMLSCVSSNERVCCTREFQNSIDDSVHETLKQEIERLDIDGLNITNKGITNQSTGELFYKGLARNITSLKSLAGIDKLWIEEGESVSERSLRILTPSVRATVKSNEEGGTVPEIWITMNRSSREDAIAKKYLARAEHDLMTKGWYEDTLCMIVQVNYTENKWFPPELEQERLDDKERLTEDEYDHIWEGFYDEQVVNNIIKKAWFDSAIDAHEKLGITPSGATITAFDPADTGKDSKAYSVRTGIHYHDVGEIDADDANEALDKAIDIAVRRHRSDVFTWDGDGMGAVLRREVKTGLSGIKCEAIMYRGSNTPDDPKTIYDGLHSLGGADKPKTNKDTFANKRAQYYTKLAQRFYNTWLWVEKGKYQDPDTIISISSDILLIDKLRSECCRIPRVPNGAGKIQLMPKEQMFVKYGIESPGMADCLAMGEVTPNLEQESEDFNFSTGRL